jgi:hypothetical protein
LAFETALTLADKIVELYSTHAQKNKKIEKTDFDDLQQLNKQLREKLSASRDLGNLVYVLRQVEDASTLAEEIKDQIDWEEQNFPKWGTNQALIHNIVSELANRSLTNLLNKTGDLEHKEFTLIAQDYRDKYEKYTRTASGYARDAMTSPEWTGRKIQVTQLHQQFEDLVSLISDDVKDKTESLIGQASSKSSTSVA